jgi:lysophospholipase L1-like esterase
MILLSNGCSFTEGYALSTPNSSWPFRLSDNLNGNVVNLALGGAGNDRIYRTTIEYLNVNSTSDLIIIGWAGLNRAELSHESGLYLRLGADILADTRQLNQDLSHVHKFWLTDLYNQYISYRNWINYVLHLQNYFDIKKINYRFFLAWGTNYIKEFINESDLALELADQSFQWRDRTQYAACRSIHKEYQELVHLTKQIDLSKWITNNQYTMQSFLNTKDCITDDTGHFLEDGHQIWAEQIKKTL